MTEQEKFEAWLFDYLVSKGMKTSDAKRMTTDAGKESIAFGAWQASRAAALEEAAKECAQVANSLDGNTDAYAAAAVCVERVLSLKESK